MNSHKPQYKERKKKKKLRTAQGCHLVITRKNLSKKYTFLSSMVLMLRQKSLSYLANDIG